MAVSLESRVPLLDYRVVELAATIPPSIKAKNSDPKYIFKQAISGIIPEEIRNRKDKKGFPTPIQHWIRRDPGFFESILLDGNAVNRGLFIPREVRQMIHSRDDHSWALWSLLNVELWYKIFIDRDPRFVNQDGSPVEKVVDL